MLKNAGIVLLGMVISLPLAQAQMRGPTVGAAPRPGSFAGPSFGATRGVTSRFVARPAARPITYPAFLWGSSYLYPGYLSEPVVTQAPAPQVVVVQVPVAKAAEPPAQPKPEPLLIEWQGDRFVRLSGANGTSRGSHAQLDYAESEARKSSTPESASSPQPAIPELQPVVLVYRDGHREEIRDYTIADGTIYARGNYWTDGYWNKKIQLTALNLPATELASRERGVKFVLPTSPNQVITRP
jgi:hypothetical protein